MKPVPALTYDEIARFWSKVRVGKPNQCWVWRAGKYASGYGQFKTRGKSYKAPRIAFTLAYHDPGQLNALHRCDNRACCNPRHVWLGTLSDNNKDRARKGRSAVNIYPSKGEKNGRAKLTVKDVRWIRRSPLLNIEVARKLGVSDTLISDIRLRKTWKHVA